MQRLFLVILLLPLLANAEGVDRLKDYFKNTNAMRANFHQLVEDKQGQKVQEVDGTMQLMRPSKFRWDYRKPYVQQIICDGDKVWLYDVDLNQVTVRDMSQAIGSSPAALLAGNNEMDKHFIVKNTSRKGSLEWVMATSKDKEGEFDKVFFGFNGEALQEMELHDNFGNRTKITFSNVERNVDLTAKSFLFQVPKGADVVGE